MKIKSVSAIEILDSRGKPTVMAFCHLENGISASASVPSGASTGASEAVELRDGHLERYEGAGCLNAVNFINQEINTKIKESKVSCQKELDHWLIDLDGTPNKSRLGANAILGVSLAYSRAISKAHNKPLFEYFSELAGITPQLPRPMINLFSGGKHAGGQTAIQDIQLVIKSANSMHESMQAMHKIYYTAAKRIEKKYGLRLLRADEGGQAPPIDDTDEMFQEAVNAIVEAGYKANEEVSITVDVAASHFFNEGKYEIDGQQLSTSGMIDKINHWTHNFPVMSVEDGLAENEWQGWSALMSSANDHVMILGDDLLCTNQDRIQQAIDQKSANSLLLKVNQIGTISEALTAYKLAKSHDWKVVVSARSGETEDDWLADLAVGWAGDFIKIGSITQSERLAKYNRLLVIEAHHGLTF